MKRLLALLSATTVVIVLVFASAVPALVHLCSNHPNQQSAQAALNQDPSLAPTLDPDGDGIACEDFFGVAMTASATATATATAAPTPTATATTTASPTATGSPTATASLTATALAPTAGPPLAAPSALVAALALVGSGLAALALMRRTIS